MLLAYIDMGRPVRPQPVPPITRDRQRSGPRAISVLAPLESLEFIQSARPVRPQEPGRSPVREHLSARLASDAIVRFVVGVADALHLFAASRAGLAEAPMHGHVLAKRRNLLRKPGA